MRLNILEKKETSTKEDIIKRYGFSEEQATTILGHHISLSIWFGYNKSVYELIDYLKNFKLCHTLDL